MALIREGMASADADKMDFAEVQNRIQVPPELQNAYERVTLAGMKVMFEKDSHKLMLKELQREGTMGEKLGRGIAGLLLILFKESNETIPPQVLIPAGVTLVMQAADFVRKTKLAKVTNKDIGEGMQVMIIALVKSFGADPARFEQMVEQFDTSNIDAAAAQQMGA